MNKKENIILSAEIEINSPIDKVWELWTGPEHIIQWNNLSDAWQNTKVENDIRAGGKFLFAMGLKNGSFNFDFCGTYDEVKTNALISYTLDDGRKTRVTFANGNPVKITETFEANKTDPPEMQRNFCQAVLNRFKQYVESTT